MGRPAKGSTCVIDSIGQCMRCTRCGEEIPIPLGLVEWVTGVMKVFAKAHKNCRRPAGQPCCWFSEVVPKRERKYPAEAKKG